jgi:hypothetical protein
MYSYDGIIRTREELDYVQYSDDDYSYHCYAAPGTALAKAERHAWQIFRMNAAETRGEWCQGTCEFKFAATNLATVQGHFTAGSGS